MANILELRQDGTDQRYYLDGSPLEPGSQIELQVHSGRWVSGRFEWGGRADVRPRLRASAGVNLPAQQITFVIHPHLLVRRPPAAAVPARPAEERQSEAEAVATAAPKTGGRSRL